MALLPLANNTRVEITIQPWALSALDGTLLTKPLYGIWFTAFDPLYAHPYALESEAGSIISNVPESLLKLALFEASRWADHISVATCGNPDTTYLKHMRYRYVILKALLSIISETTGVSPVAKKVLGDFEIEFDTSSGDSNLISRILNEMHYIEPVVQSGGCLGLGSSHPASGVTKGANDPYRPMFSRGWITPDVGSVGTVRGKHSPWFHKSNPYSSDRYKRTNHRWSTNPRKGGR